MINHSKNSKLLVLFLTTFLVFIIACKSSEDVQTRHHGKMASRSQMDASEADTTVPEVSMVDSTTTDSAAADSTKPKKTSYKKIIKKADRVEKGLMNLYKVKKKLYLEIPVDLFGKEMLLGSTISETSDNDFGAVGSKPHPPMHLAFTLEDSTVLLRKIERQSITRDRFKKLDKALAKNSIGAILKKFDVQGFNKDHTTAMIEITGYFKSDIKSLSPFNKRHANLPRGITYSTSFKGGRSFIGDFKAFEDNISIKSHLSYGYNIKAGKRTIQKDQPFTAVMTRTFVLLPAQLMEPRLGDARIGVGTIQKYEFTDPLNKAGEVHFARRFRLQPKDKHAYAKGKLVEPLHPITFYVDSDFPESWKKPIKQGIEDWNKAFEKIGFKNAVVAKDYPTDDPEFDPDNIKYSVVRYVPNASARVGGSAWIDPRTGEILNGSMYLYHDLVKRITQQRFVLTAAADKRVRSVNIPEEYKKDDIRYYVRRQMGFRLGFRPNYVASSSIDVQSLRSPSFTQKHGTEYSTMDAARYNYVAQPGDGARLTSKHFGPYDYYLVNWDYRYFNPDKYSREQVREKLNKLVDERADDIEYRYGIGGYSIKDPTVQGGDLGNNAVEASQLSIKNLKYIMTHLNDWVGDHDKDFSYRRRMWDGLTEQYISEVNYVVSYLGGVYSNLKNQGDPRPRFEPVSPQEQKQAYQFLFTQLHNLNWLMDDQVVQNFTLTRDLPAILRKQLLKLAMNGPLMVYIPSHLAHQKNEEAYTPREAMQDLYEAVWDKTIHHKKLTDVDIEMQKAFVGTYIKYSQLPQKPYLRESSEENTAANASSLTKTANDLQQAVNLKLSLKNNGVSSPLTPDQAVGATKKGAYSYSSLGLQGSVNFLVGPPVDLISYKYLLKVKDLLRRAIKETSNLDIKAHYELLQHQLNKVL